MLNECGQLMVPLYHGTSSHYLDSINKYGLGGVRDAIVFDMNVLSALADRLSDPSNQTEWWELNSVFVEPMLEQRITGGGFNFRYGGTYLTPSRFTACRYATSNRMGSEYISTIHQAFAALLAVNATEANEIIPSDHRLRDIFEAKHSPILITVKGLGAEMLRTEKGENIESQLERMIEMKSAVAGVDPEVLWQQFNFEISRAIQPEFLTFEFIADE